MKPLDIACRRCAAQPNEACVVSGTDIPLDVLHAERIEDAAAMTTVADPVDAAAFDTAVAKRLF